MNSLLYTIAVDKTLNPTAVRVYIFLYEKFIENTFVIKDHEIAAEMGISIPSVERAMKSLADNSYIIRDTIKAYHEIWKNNNMREITLRR